MPTTQLTEPSKDTGIYKFSRALSLVTRMTSWNVIRRVRTFRSYQWFGYIFYHNLDCVLLLFIFIRLDRKYYLYFYLNCWQNCFYKVLIWSLPSGDLLLQTECEYTIVQINTQYNVLVNQVFANPVSVFILLEFWSLDNITVCILILSFCLCYLMRLLASFQVALWTCFLKSFFVCILYNLYSIQALYNLPWRASVSSHQVQCNIPTFEALLRKYKYLFLERCRKSNNVWLRALIQSDCLYSSLFFEHYNRILLCDWVIDFCSVRLIDGVSSHNAGAFYLD